MMKIANPALPFLSKISHYSAPPRGLKDLKTLATSRTRRFLLLYDDDDGIIRAFLGAELSHIR